MLVPLYKAFDYKTYLELANLDFVDERIVCLEHLYFAVTTQPID